MTGLDTNVLVRYLTQDDPVQSKLANEVMESGLSKDSPGFVSPIVLCELLWVLEDCYGQTRRQLGSVVESLLKVAELQICDPDTVRQALSDFRNSKADFSDHLIARTNAGCSCDTTLTFDKLASKSPGFTLLA